MKKMKKMKKVKKVNILNKNNLTILKIKIIFILLFAFGNLKSQDFEITLPISCPESTCTFINCDYNNFVKPKISHGSPQIATVIVSYKLKAKFGGDFLEDTLSEGFFYDYDFKCFHNYRFKIVYATDYVIGGFVNLFVDAANDLKENNSDADSCDLGKIPNIKNKEHIYEFYSLNSVTFPDTVPKIWRPSSNYNYLWFYTSPVFNYYGCVYILDFEIEDLGSFDYEPPTIPDNVHITQRGPHFITVKWSSSEDNACLKGYNVYLDSQLYKTVEEPFCKITGLKTCTQYQIGIEAEDYAGNISDMRVITGATTSDKPPVIRLNKNYTDSVRRVIIASETIYLEDGFEFEANSHNQYFIAKIEPCQYDKDYPFALFALSEEELEDNFSQTKRTTKQDSQLQDNAEKNDENNFIAKFNIYPNPGNGLFNVFIYDFIKSGEVYIYNSMGILVKKIQINSNNFTIDLTEEPNGFYFVKFYSDNNVYTAKIIKR